MKSINIFGDIIGSEADRWYYSEVTPAQIVDALKEAGGEPVEILINSNGGSVTGGLAIANAIKAYPGETTCTVLGIAASMASVIACSGKTLKMGEGAFLMIHNPYARTTGTAEELRKDADTLDKQRDSLIAFYLSKCDKTADELKALMDAETWISRDEAKANGWNVSDYDGELKAAASLTRRGFETAPEAAKGLLTLRTEKPVEKPVEGNAAIVEDKPAMSEHKAEKSDNWEARFKGLSTKFNELKAKLDESEGKHTSEVVALNAEIENLKTLNETSQRDLATAKAEVNNLTAKLTESEAALQTATKDLADCRDSLKSAEDKAKQLEATRDMLTAGVLTPPATDESYKAKYKAAKTPEEREALRKAKLAGKIN